MVLTGSPKPSMERVRIPVNYGVSDRHSVADTKCHYIDPRIESRHLFVSESFPLGQIWVVGQLVRFRGSLDDPEAILGSIQADLGLRNAIPLELHALASHLPWAQIPGPILVKDIQHADLYQCIYRTKQWERSLELLHRDQIRGDRYRYLAIEREWH